MPNNIAENSLEGNYFYTRAEKLTCSSQDDKSDLRVRTRLLVKVYLQMSSNNH